MGACLTDQDLAAFVDGSAQPDQMSAWNQHLDGCNSCAARRDRKVAVRTVPPGPSAPAENPGSGSAETITVKPPLDAGAGLPEDAIPGYHILKELHARRR